MVKWGIIIMVALVLVGCAAAGVPAPQDVTAETVGSVTQTQTSSIINNEIPPWLIGVIILLAGWAIPTPTTMIKGMFSTIYDIINMFK